MKCCIKMLYLQYPAFFCSRRCIELAPNNDKYLKLTCREQNTTAFSKISWHEKFWQANGHFRIEYLFSSRKNFKQEKNACKPQIGHPMLKSCMCFVMWCQREGFFPPRQIADHVRLGPWQRGRLKLPSPYWLLFYLKETHMAVLSQCSV